MVFIVCSDPNTLFRGNSLASKVIDEFMKFVGCSYLQSTLQGCIDEVCELNVVQLTLHYLDFDHLPL